MAVPTTLAEVIEQAKSSTGAAIASGSGRWLIEIVVPEIALEAQSLTWEFAQLFEHLGAGLKVLFCDTGAAALARRDWGETHFRINDLGSRFTPVSEKVSPEDEAYLVVAPSAVEVKFVEELCNLVGDRPVFLLIPQLEDVSIVGIGYAARQLRERFLSTLMSCYYFRPLEGAAVLKTFDTNWQVWQEKDNEYELIAEKQQKPTGEALERLLLAQDNEPQSEANKAPTKKSGLFSSMQRFLKALNQ